MSSPGHTPQGRGRPPGASPKYCGTKGSWSVERARWEVTTELGGESTLFHRKIYETEWTREDEPLDEPPTDSSSIAAAPAARVAASALTPAGASATVSALSPSAPPAVPSADAPAAAIITSASAAPSGQAAIETSALAQPSGRVSAIVERLQALTLHQLRGIEVIIGTYEEDNAKLLLSQQELETAQKQRDAFKKDAQRVQLELEAALKKVGKLKEFQSAKGFMTRNKYAKFLMDARLLTKCPGAKHDGQHVFHIIANSNGGPDHVDNFLYALGGVFNIKLRNKYDHVNCFIAGKEKSRLAAKVALRVARDPDLANEYIERRRGEAPTLFTQGEHRDLCQRFSSGDGTAIGEELYSKGDREFTRTLRANAPR